MYEFQFDPPNDDKLDETSDLQNIMRRNINKSILSFHSSTLGKDWL